MLPTPYPEVMRAGAEIFQMESRNPHLHDADKGDGHINEMIEYSLGVLYHSPICPEGLRQEILDELRRMGILEPGAEPVQPRRSPALANLDFEKAGKSVDWPSVGNTSPA